MWSTIASARMPLQISAYGRHKAMAFPKRVQSSAIEDLR